MLNTNRVSEQINSRINDIEKTSEENEYNEEIQNLCKVSMMACNVAKSNLLMFEESEEIINKIRELIKM